MNEIRQRRRFTVGLWAALAVCLIPIAAAAAPVDETLDAARARYGEADFVAALSLLDGVLANSQLAKEEVAAALELQALCHMAELEIGLAHRSFCALHCLDRNWRPSPAIFVVEEREEFERARLSCQCPATPEERAAESVAPPPTRSQPADSDLIPAPKLPSPKPIEPTIVQEPEDGDFIFGWKVMVPVALAAGGVLYTLIGQGGDDTTGPNTVPDFPDPPGSP